MRLMPRTKRNLARVAPAPHECWPRHHSGRLGRKIFGVVCGLCVRRDCYRPRLLLQDRAPRLRVVPFELQVPKRDEQRKLKKPRDECRPESEIQAREAFAHPASLIRRATAERRVLGELDPLQPIRHDLK